MTKSLNLKKLIGVYSVLLFIIILYFVSPINVNAEDCPNPDDVIINSGFKLEYARDSSNQVIPDQYYLSMGTDAGAQDYGISFAVEIVDGSTLEDVSNSTHASVIRSLGNISFGDKIEVSASNSDYTNGYIYVFLRATCEDDTASSPYEMYDYVYASKVGNGIPVQGGECVTAPPVTITTTPLDCSGYNPNGTSFKDKFCNAKNKAFTENKNTYCKDSNCKYPAFESESNYSRKYGNNTFLKFQCSSNLDDIPSDPADLEGEKYYLNKNYIYGVSTYTKDAIYTRNLAPSHVETTTTSCEVTCEEAVEAEYGPPVASKAGMCFEYKVRVTSRVSCYMSKAPDTPKCPTGYCTPEAACTNGRSWWHQAGPSEDFDACVKKCDNGKYTKKCSDKCYKQVYGNSLPAAKVVGEGDDTTSTEPYFTIENEFIRLHNERYGGDVLAQYNEISKYYYDKNGSGGDIVWVSEPQENGELIPGRYYYEANWTRGSTGDFYHYKRDNAGFFRAVYSSGNVCDDTCVWNGCSGDVYLNPGQDQIDYADNLEIYNDLLDSCQGQATCSTTTAEISISVDYRNRKGDPQPTIDFPYSRGKDSITHNSGGTVSLPTDDDSVLLPNDPTEGEGILGCYKPGASETNLYRLTWSFPGTWINNKSGEISYTKQGTCDEAAGATCSWRDMKQKFCLPNNTGRVNADWWNAYYKKVIDDKGIETSTQTSEVQDVCLKSSTSNKTIISPGSSINPEEYNIHAKAVKFGYFDWNIQMDCFYATNPTPLVSTDQNVNEEDVPEECKTAPDNYRIRSIDLENVFPAKDGSETTDPSSYGRLPGHNWTKYSNPSAKDASFNNPNYFESTSDPISYLTKIQTEKDSIYDEEVEYEFRLSPKDLRDIRKKFVGNGSSATGFSDFDLNDFYMDKNGVARYYSNAIRGEVFDSSAIVAINNNKNGGLTCNNMKGHTDTCE